MTDRRVIHQLPLGLIDDADRMRHVNDAQVELLKGSMAGPSGLLSPIHVGQADIQGRHVLIAGAHRLEAARRLNWDKIDALVVAVASADEAKLVEIEENLIRHDLTALDRAFFLAEWRRVYNQINKIKGVGRPKKLSPDLADISEPYALGFDEAVKERLRMSPRSIERAIARAGLASSLRAALASHPAADNGSILDMLVPLSAELQAQLAAEITPEMSIGELRRRVAELLDRDLQGAPDVFARLVKLWGKANPDEKARFRQHIAPRSGGQRT
jgi:ParB family chromosome partitioning protein